jgi:hypothetical protein
VTDDVSELGLGAIQSPADANDWHVHLLYATVGAEPVTAPPPTYQVPAPQPATLNQGSTPQCVAFSSAWLKEFEDLRDTGAFVPNTGAFFTAIGGGPNGAVVRNALAQMLNVGYPPVSGSAAAHKIAAYYAVPVTQADIKSALMTFGPVLISTPWFNSWFHPNAAGVLPAPDTQVGGHAIAVVGWDDTKGFRLQNSWGSGWGISGDCFLPYAYLPRVWEAWKAVDVIEPKPAPAPIKGYRIRVAANSVVLIAVLNAAGRIDHWDRHPWGAKPSGAACGAPVVKKGKSSGQATVVPVTSGMFKGRYVRIGGGTSLVILR